MKKPSTKDKEKARLQRIKSAATFGRPGQGRKTTHKDIKAETNKNECRKKGQPDEND